AMRRLGPAPVAGKISVRILLDVGRRRRDQRLVSPQGDVMGSPAGLFVCAARGFQRVQPGPASERRGGRVSQRIPRVRRDFTDTIVYAQLHMPRVPPESPAGNLLAELS